MHSVTEKAMRLRVRRELAERLGVDAGLSAEERADPEWVDAAAWVERDTRPELCLERVDLTLLG